MFHVFECKFGFPVYFGGPCQVLQKFIILFIPSLFNIRIHLDTILRTNYHFCCVSIGKTALSPPALNTPHTRTSRFTIHACSGRCTAQRGTLGGPLAEGVPGGRSGVINIVFPTVRAGVLAVVDGVTLRAGVAKGRSAGHVPSVHSIAGPGG